MIGIERRSSRIERTLTKVGEYCWDRPWWVLGAWLIATVVAALITAAYADRLVSGAGSIEGSQSARVDAELTRVFGIRDSQTLIFTYSNPVLNHDIDARDAFVAELEDKLFENPVVESVLRASDLVDQPRDDKGHALVIALDTEDALAAEQQVPVVREAIAETLQNRPDIEWAVSGRGAVSYDLAIFSNNDSMKSELRALPLALLVLLYAFGAVLSASLPIITAVAARTVAFAGIVFFAGFFEISTLSQAIVTMLAIALGIDYSLFVYHRYRQVLKDAGACAPDEIDQRRRDAFAEAMGQSGLVVLYSGIAVAIGMTSLLLTPMMEMRSIGVGGLAAVVVSVAAALTMLPSLLSLIGARALDWPNRAKPGRGYEATSARWCAWGRSVVAHPWIAIVTSLTVVLLMAAPALYTQTGFPDDEFFPQELESVRGVQMLEEMEIKGFSSPIFIIISSKDGGKVITRQSTAQLRALKDSIEADPRIAEVSTPRLSERPSFMPFPAGSAQKLVSETEDKILFRVIPRTDTKLIELRALVREIPSWIELPDVVVEVGGQPQFLNDFDEGVTASYAPVIISVLIATGLALLLMLGAPLASFKALMLNLLSVGAGFGMVVFVFQLGYGAEVFGVAGPTELIPSSVPVVIFAVLFGLSMDYEIFLVSRMKDIYLACGDNERSIIEALGDTGSVISSAALIMALVFGAFAFSQIIIVQMVGVGLATAILVDALIIRAVLGPALMMVAGKWNWWPLFPDSSNHSAEQPKPAA
ncbi:MMPL family transporter [uncultured Erythrobacter sp.]|uniref:MMPL family transporter n=1 Tax=uncultured Erythrobacter sp. TaxID=263913 RepID=UPI0026202618|nr:MMPL family transporter [uncultured Erythrobacter sp.]